MPVVPADKFFWITIAPTARQSETESNTIMATQSDDDDDAYRKRLFAGIMRAFRETATLKDGDEIDIDPWIACDVMLRLMSFLLAPVVSPEEVETACKEIGDRLADEIRSLHQESPQDYGLDV